jgi:hypothetical protein
LADANRPAEAKAAKGTKTMSSEEEREKAALARDKAKFEKTKKL